MLLRLEGNNEHFDVLAAPEGDIALLAAGLMKQPLAVIGPTELAPALNRFKNQMNENAARFVRVGVLPEMNHNESVAWGGVGPMATRSVRPSPALVDLAGNASIASSNAWIG